MQGISPMIRNFKLQNYKSKKGKEEKYLAEREPGGL